MIDKTLMLKLAEFVLLNAYSVNATGLYNGKVGLSVCLFEVARCCRNEKLEDHAFELVQESLLTINTDIGFESGLSGIGHTLLYLIRNEFLEADVDELFGTKRQKINMSLLQVLSDEYLYQFTSVLYYWVLSQTEPDEKKFFSLYMDRIMDTLKRSFHTFETRKDQGHKMDVCNGFGKFLRFVNCRDSSFPTVAYDEDKLHALCRQYVSLYRSGLIASDYKTDHFLYKWAQRNRENEIAGEALASRQRHLSRIYPCVMTLKEKIDWLFLLSENASCNRESLVVIEDSIFNLDGMNPEQSIMANLDPKDLYFSYNNGIARLLLYLVYKQTLSEGKDVARFNHIFI